MSTSPKPTIPPLSLVLAYGPALVLLALGIGALALPPYFAFWALACGQIWAAAILLFLAGVRRGLSFFTGGGPRPVQIVTMMWVFLLGLATLLVPASRGFVVAAIGYLSIALLDPRAAPRGEVPDYFARLRPPQMAIFVAGCVLLFVATLSPLR